MHKRNAFLIALLLTVLIGGALTVFDTLHRSDAIGIFYFPVFLLAVALSGGGHSVAATAIWSSFVAYTLVYLLLFISLYAVVWEFVLLRRAFIHLLGPDSIKRVSEGALVTTLSDFGRAVQSVEKSRRGHWVLQNLDALNLSESPDIIGARAIVENSNARITKGLMREVHRRIAVANGSAAADAAVAELKREATSLVRASDQMRAQGGPSGSVPRAP